MVMAGIEVAGLGCLSCPLQGAGLKPCNGTVQGGEGFEGLPTGGDRELKALGLRVVNHTKADLCAAGGVAGEGRAKNGCCHGLEVVGVWAVSTTGKGDKLPSG